MHSTQCSNPGKRGLFDWVRNSRRACAIQWAVAEAGLSGGTGRRRRLKISRRSPGVWVRFPPQAPTVAHACEQPRELWLAGHATVVHRSAQRGGGLQTMTILIIED